MDILKRFSRDTAAALRTPEQRHADALAAYEKARGELGVASLDDEAAAVEAARKALSKAEAALVEADSALEAMRARQAAAIAAKARQDRAARRAETTADCAELGRLAPDLDRAVNDVAGIYRRALELSAKVWRECGREDVAARLSPIAVDEALRLHLRKVGFDWAITSAQSRIELPTFSQRIQEGADMAKQAMQVKE